MASPAGTEAAEIRGLLYEIYDMVSQFVGAKPTYVLERRQVTCDAVLDAHV
jgi:hypothetical protein